MKNKPSRQRQLIQRAATKYGFGKVKISWEPWGISLEMCGPAGGWEVKTLDGERVFLGYNVKEVIQNIRLERIYNLGG